LKALDLVSQRLAEDGQRFSKGMTVAVAAIESMSSKLAAMQTPEKVIEIKLQPMIQGLTRAVNAFDKTSQAQALSAEAIVSSKIDHGPP
jgi:O-succinylbenzoate synthase